MSLIDKEKYTAQIFKRGQKKELFDDGDELKSVEAEFEQKMEDLREIWGLPRTGYVYFFVYFPLHLCNSRRRRRLDWLEQN